MSTTQPNAFNRVLLVLSLLVLLILVAAWLVHRNETRTTVEKLSDAVEVVPSVVSSAADDLAGSSSVANAGEALSKAGDAASTAVSKAGDKAEAAMSETSEDLKAAIAKQKAQDKADAQKKQNEKR